ncbi:SCO family protein [Chitinibacter bivalviorum]|uniref:SCO family protein n=1 Tax=Chitinibacter bivalviorum TaxID=2739434 RepID=A0A7H9BGL7_9NEIS|nr:SCO family protein [Chitinibacter bivalviorum]QLG87406.1 SCO family protein [Chitinibacter bivalviorum]
MSKLIRLAFISFICTLLLACSKPAFQGTDISQSQIGGGFSLIDHHGQLKTLADYQGKVVVLFFGYTSCPDVCPTTMAELRNTMSELGEAAKDVQVLFISVDPERDTTQLLSQYVPAFHPSFIGLTGNKSQIDAATKNYRAIYQKQGQGNNYLVDHTAGSYLIDRKGNTRVLVNYGAGAATFTHDIQLLLAD